jgi:hypothetical protein
MTNSINNSICVLVLCLTCAFVLPHFTTLMHHQQTNSINSSIHVLVLWLTCAFVLPHFTTLMRIRGVSSGERGTSSNRSSKSRPIRTTPTTYKHAV